MRIQLSRLQIRVVAGGQRFGADLQFRGGLNLIRANNSAGKSICVNSIVWALGLEGMLGPQHMVPLPYAMTSEIEGPEGIKHAVTEAHVALEIRRSDGAYLAIRRQVTGQTNTKLVATWEGPLLSSPRADYQHRDYYVRRSGAAKERRGFHRFFTEWCGWEMPEVARYDGSAVPLYVEAITPLWIVEQKRGWAGLQALTPTYLGISDVRKRALEHVLVLDVLNRRARIIELNKRLQEIRSKWSHAIAVFLATARKAGGTASGLPQRPTGDWPPTPEPTLRISKDGGWMTIQDAVREAANQIESLRTQSLSRETVNAELSAELEVAEQKLELAMATSAQMRRSIARDQETAQQASRHLDAIEQDKRRHKDVLLLRRLGSQDESLFRTESCPVCNRDLGDVLLDEDSRDRVMGVEETINYLDAQADLTKTVIRSTEASLQAREAQINALTHQSSELRSRVFALRTALTGGGSAFAEAEEFFTVRRRLDIYEEVDRAFASVWEDLSELSYQWRTMESELKELRSCELSDEDRRKIDRLQSEFLSQLSGYEFTSFDPTSMIISDDTYQPTHEGYDPAFESSASDVIRIIWAYLLSLQRVSSDLGLNHPGLVIFDEPRQQMTHEISFRALLRRAAAIGGQVLFATSETPQGLSRMLDGLNPNVINYDGKVLQPLLGSSR